MLLWLWCRLAAVAPTGPLAWEPPYAMDVALKKKRQKDKNKKPKNNGLLYRGHNPLTGMQITGKGGKTNPKPPGSFVLVARLPSPPSQEGGKGKRGGGRGGGGVGMILPFKSGTRKSHFSPLITSHWLDPSLLSHLPTRETGQCNLTWWPCS